MRDLVSDYVNAAQGTKGVVTDAMVEEFNQKYAGRLTEDERAALVSWIRSSSEGVGRP